MVRGQAQRECRRQRQIRPGGGQGTPAATPSWCRGAAPLPPRAASRPRARRRGDKDPAWAGRGMRSRKRPDRRPRAASCARAAAAAPRPVAAITAGTSSPATASTVPEWASTAAAAASTASGPATASAAAGTQRPRWPPIASTRSASSGEGFAHPGHSALGGRARTAASRRCRSRPAARCCEPRRVAARSCPAARAAIATARAAAPRSSATPASARPSSPASPAGQQPRLGDAGGQCRGGPAGDRQQHPGHPSRAAGIRPSSRSARRGAGGAGFACGCGGRGGGGHGESLGRKPRPATWRRAVPAGPAAPAERRVGEGRARGGHRPDRKAAKRAGAAAIASSGPQ